MPIITHYHRYPSCGTVCNTACSGEKGECRQCFMAEHGEHKNEYACFHVFGEVSANDVFQVARELIGGPSSDSNQEQKTCCKE